MASSVVAAPRITDLNLGLLQRFCLTEWELKGPKLAISGNLSEKKALQLAEKYKEPQNQSDLLIHGQKKYLMFLKMSGEFQRLPKVACHTLLQTNRIQLRSTAQEC